MNKAELIEQVASQTGLAKRRFGVKEKADRLLFLVN